MRINKMDIKWDTDLHSMVRGMCCVNLDLTNVGHYDIVKLKEYIRQGLSISIYPENEMIWGSSTNKDNNSSDIKVIKVIYHNPATIVFWSDGTKTVVKCDERDSYDPEKGFYIACAKKLFGNNYKAVGRMNKALEMAVMKGDVG